MLILHGSIAHVNTTIESLPRVDVCLFVYSKQRSMQFRIFRMRKNFRIGDISIRYLPVQN